MRFEVDSAQVSAAGSRVMGSVGTLGAEADALTRYLTELQGSWRGQAATEFQAVLGEWRAAHEQLKASLERISQALSNAASTYAEAEAQATRIFHR